MDEYNTITITFPNSTSLSNKLSYPLSSVVVFFLSLSVVRTGDVLLILPVLAAHTSFNPPEPPVDHWGLNEPLPRFEKVYKLGRQNGVVTLVVAAYIRRNTI